MLFIIKFFKKFLLQKVRIIFCKKEYFLFKRELFNIVEIDDGFIFDFIIINSLDEFEKLQALNYNFSQMISFEILKKGLLQKGNLACVFDRKELIHLTWFSVSFESSIYDSLFITGVFGEKNIGFIGPCETNAKFRGRGIYKVVLDSVCKCLLERGIKIAMINSKSNNSASIRGIIKAGFKLSKRVEVKTLLGRKFIRINPI